MPVDILPALIAVSGLDLQSGAAAWEKAWMQARKQNHAREDSRTYVLTLENFRQAHPFDYSALGVAARNAQTRKVNDGTGPKGTV